MKILADKTIMITGGSRGIGQAIAIACAQQGAHVGINYHQNKQAAETLAAQLRDEYEVSAISVGFDVRDLQAVDKAIKTYIDNHGQIHGWVNNAGINLPGLLLTQTAEMIEAQIQTNVVGPINCAKAILPHMMENRQGVIINLGSITHRFVSPGQSVYAASKGAVVSLTRALAKEYGKKGIRVVCVEPGPIETDMFHNSKMLAGTQIKSNIPLKRFGETSEVANAVTHLLSDQASFVTGGVYTIDGGYSLGC